MLEYFKIILAKVSFDDFLFEKELRKALITLSPDEIAHLRDWSYKQFGHQYGPVLNGCFLEEVHLQGTGAVAGIR